MKFSRPKMSMMYRNGWVHCCDKYRILYTLVFFALFGVASFVGGGGENFNTHTLLNNLAIRPSTRTSQAILEAPDDPDPAISKFVKRKIPGSVTSPTDNCPITCQVKIYSLSPGGKWILQSFDSSGNEKKIGGDEFYISFHDANANQQKHPTAVAIITDRNDGTYELDFVEPPLTDPTTAVINQGLGGGNITINYQYSCGIGHMGPPTKDIWLDGGSLPYKYDIKVQHRPPIRPFRTPPCHGGLSRFETVLAFGDSAMKQFVKNNSRVYQPNLVFRIKRRKPWTMALIDEHLMVLRKQLGRDLDDAASKPVNSTALIVGSAIWDVLASNHEKTLTRRTQFGGEDISETNAIFQDHLKACRRFIMTVRQEHPNVVLFWKSPSAMHVHVVDPSAPINAAQNSAAERVRYMSSSRTAELYHLQRKLMEELHVPILDIYEATYLSASWTFSGDGRHYRSELHRHMIQWFYQ